MLSVKTSIDLRTIMVLDENIKRTFNRLMWITRQLGKQFRKLALWSRAEIKFGSKESGYVR
ncbi:MAG: hypothetical protein EB015_14440 [Methylocystaceae bacterium]|nr:hypothetical protein [Methylocystaceae bacterium]